MAEMVPDSLPLGRSAGEGRLFDVFKRLPDDCVVYYECGDATKHPAFVVICPDVGLAVLKHAGWRAGHMSAVNERSVDLTGNPPTTELNPVSEARECLQGLAKRCKLEPGFDPLLKHAGGEGRDFVFPVGYAAVLSNITEQELLNHPLGDLTHELPLSRVITREDLVNWHENPAYTLDQVKAALRHFFEEDTGDTRLTAGQVRTLRALLHPEIRLADRPNAPAVAPEVEPALNIDIAVLDLRQERHARSLGSGHRLIYGVAGSGKTVVLVARARFLARQCPDKRILFVCFNVTLAAHLRNKLRDCASVEVHHFDQWSRLNHVTRADGEDDDDLGEGLLNNLQRGGDAARLYDTVLIDEAQDFAPNWFRCVLAAMKDPLDGDLVIVSDASQGLYRRTGISWQSLGIRARGRTVHVGFDLDKNYRNTREIVELARQFASPPSDDEDAGMLCIPVDPSKACRSIGMKPVLFRERFRAAECNRVLDLVRGLLKGKWLNHDLPSPLVGREIGIICPMIAGQSQNEFNNFLDHLRKLDEVVWLVKYHGEDRRTKVNEPGIKVQTIHSAKGLEYRAVIIMWADLLPRIFFKDHDKDEERRLMYVALTRGSDFLAITYSCPSEFMEEIRRSGAVLVP